MKRLKRFHTAWTRSGGLPPSITALRKAHSSARIRVSGVTEYRPDHSGLRPANFTTLAHFSVSAAMSIPKSAGEPGSGVPPKSASRALNLGSVEARLCFLVELLNYLCGGVVWGRASAPN